MRRIDLWLIENVFEPASQEIEGATGQNHWRVARACMLTSLAVWGADCIQRDAGLAYALWGLAVVTGTGFALMTMVIERMKRWNWLKHDLGVSVLRMVLLSLLLWSWWLGGFVWGDIGMIAMLLCYYFAGCEDLPPKERRWWVLAPQGGAA